MRPSDPPAPNPDPSLSRRKRRLFAAVLAAAAVLLPLAAGEAWMRWISPHDLSDPVANARRSLAYDAALYAKNVLRREARTAIADGVTYPVNSLGYRGREFAPDKPAGGLRVMVYGGSAVFDLSADGYTSWPEQMEPILTERLGRPVEVINAGIPGHASADSLGRLLFEGHAFQPDVVVLCNAWNDIKRFHCGEPLLRTARPFRPDGRIVHHGALDRWLCRHSRLYVRLRNRWWLARQRVGSEGTVPAPVHADGVHPAAAAQYRLNLEMFAAAARAAGALPVLVTQPRLPAKSNTPEQRKRIGYHYTALTHDQLCGAFDLTDELIRQAARAQDALVIEAAAALNGRDEFLRDHVHTTPAGSARLAETVAEAIAGRLSVPSP